MNNMKIKDIYDVILENLTLENKKLHSNLSESIKQCISNTFDNKYKNKNGFKNYLYDKFSNINKFGNFEVLVTDNIKLIYNLDYLYPEIKFSYPIYDLSFDFIYAKDNSDTDFIDLEMRIDKITPSQHLTFYYGSFDLNESNLWRNDFAKSNYGEEFKLNPEIFYYITKNYSTNENEIKDNISILFDIDLNKNPFLSTIIKHFKEVHCVLSDNNKLHFKIRNN